MQSLGAIRVENPQWSLEEFVDVVNRSSSRYVPRGESGRGSVQQEVNARLVRHYTGAGMVDRPGREGKEARYGFRHLLQMLVLRRLLLEGLTAQAIEPITTGRSDEELETLLESGGRVTVEPVNPAVAFLREIRHREEEARRGPRRRVARPDQPVGPGSERRRRSGESPGEPRRMIGAPLSLKEPARALASDSRERLLEPAAPVSEFEQEWQRILVVPGLELHVQKGFEWPGHPRDKSMLSGRLEEILESQMEKGRRRS